MKMFPALFRCLAGALLALGALAAAAKPNLVFILADDLGYGDVGCYGAPDIRTPNLDRIAAQGVRCTDGYAAFPVCSPSRAAILTGRYPHRLGPAFEDYFGGGVPDLDPQKSPTIARLLQDAGYATGCFGKWNVANSSRRPANDYGFDKWVGLHLNHDYFSHRLVANDELDLFEDGKPREQRGVWSDTIFADEAVKFIAANQAKPFFIYLAFQAPHDPIQDPDIPFDPPRDKKNPANRPTYVKMVERLDHEIGRVLQALETRGLATNTLVFVTSDNGAQPGIGRNLPLRGAKQELLEGGIRVPLLLRWPGVLAAGKVFTNPVTAMDLTATLAAAGGTTAAPTAPFDGVDLLPALTGRAELPAEQPDFWRRRMVNVPKGEYFIRQSVVRKGDWKYLRTYQHLGGGKFSEKFAESLFNLRADIAEEHNQATAAPAKLAELKSDFARWEAEMATASAPSPKTAPVRTAENERVLVGVNYFAGWWEELPNKWHGRGWNTNEPDWRPDFPEREPLTGCYNDVATMDREIVAAAEHGVDFFSILWYFAVPGDKHVATVPRLNRGLANFRDSTNAALMKFMIEYCNAADFSAPDDARWADCLQTWVAAMRHPSYLRVGGRPVFKLHDAYQFWVKNGRDVARCRARLESLRQAARAAGLGEMLIGGGIMGRNEVKSGNFVAQLFDFTATYMDVPPVEIRPAEQPYALLAAEAREARARHSADPIPWLPFLAAGWNPRPWTHPKADENHRRFFAFPTREEWLAELRAARDDFGKFPQLGLPLPNGGRQKIFTIYAWNEFGEGGIVAPTKGEGAMKLEGIREVFGPKRP